MNPDELERLRAEALKIVQTNELTGLCAELARGSVYYGHQLGAAMNPTEVRAFLRGTWIKRNAGVPGTGDAKQHPRIAESHHPSLAGKLEDLAPERESTGQVRKRMALESAGDESFPELVVSEEVVVGGVMRDIPSERRHAATREFLDAIMAIYREFNVPGPPWLSATLEIWHSEHVVPGSWPGDRTA
ncbi:MAG: hypothetical protein JO306_01505 [Gemmatimonadetes bacterium]|nr:hypothetical protein [Gemmatimonadota bacterium]